MSDYPDKLYVYVRDGMREVREHDIISGNVSYTLTSRCEALERAAEKMAEALGIIMGICQSDLETHFGEKIGKKIRKAMAQFKALKADGVGK